MGGSLTVGLTQPSGEETPLTFITVGGRTSCVVEAVQTLPEGLVIKTRKRKAGAKAEDDPVDDATVAEDVKLDPVGFQFHHSRE